MVACVPGSIPTPPIQFSPFRRRTRPRYFSRGVGEAEANYSRTAVTPRWSKFTYQVCKCRFLWDWNLLLPSSLVPALDNLKRDAHGWCGFFCRHNLPLPPPRPRVWTGPGDEYPDCTAVLRTVSSLYFRSESSEQASSRSWVRARTFLFSYATTCILHLLYQSSFILLFDSSLEHIFWR